MDNERIEKKFVLGKLKEDFFKKFLLLNGFIKQFQNRSITSIYLDTNNYNLAKDNIKLSLNPSKELENKSALII